MNTNRTKRIRQLLGGVTVALAASLLFCATPSIAQETTGPLFKVQYFDNSLVPNVVTMFNPKFQPASNKQLECEMIYVFDSHEEMQACCGCPVTNNGYRRIRTDTDLLGKPAGGVPVPNGVIKVVTTDINLSSGKFSPCNPALISTSSAFEFPIPAWITHAQNITLASGVIQRRPAEHDFEIAPLQTGELNSLAQTCSFIHTNNTGNGICTCGVGDSVAPTSGSGQR